MSLVRKVNDLDELVEGLYKCGYIAVYDETNQLSFKYMKELVSIEEETKK